MLWRLLYNVLRVLKVPNFGNMNFISVGAGFRISGVRIRGVLLYYYDTVLQFGARSSPSLFNDFATAAKYIMWYNGATYAENYLDDYITMGSPGSGECHQNLDTMIQTCNDLSFSVNPNKICQPNLAQNTVNFLPEESCT